MLIFAAIDLYEGKAVRLYQGDYAQMTVYSDKPWELVEDFVRQGVTHLHIVDLEGAKKGEPANMETIRAIRDAGPLFISVGGGIRSMSTIQKYMDMGINRVVLGTSAITNPELLREAVEEYGDKIAVGADMKDGYIAIIGWTVSSGIDAFSFCKRMQELGIRTLICTDISKDGAMQGTNRNLYRRLSQTLNLDIVASGGVSTLDDVKALRKMDLYGAVIGKAYYTGAISLKDAIEAAR